MARVKRTLTSIKNLTEEEKNAVKDLLFTNEKFKKAAEEIRKIFSTHFCFDEEEIELYIENICEKTDEKLVATLQDIYEAFVKNDISGLNREERRDYARGVVDNTIEIFAKENNAVKDEFIDVLREAKALKIDPFKLAIKTNIQGANLAKFQTSLEALMLEKYYAPKGQPRELFSQEETKDILEKCASVAYNLNSQSIQEILNVLNDILYDKKTNSFVYEPREIIKSVPSILLAKPKDIEDAIDMLKLCNGYEMDSKLLMRIKASPSLLLVKSNNVTTVNKYLTEEIEKLITKKPYAERTKTEKNPHSFAVALSDKFTLDINHLTQIEKVNVENLSIISEVLEHYLGIDNTVTCMQNMSVISSDPSMLEFMLATLVKEERTSKLPLRDYFVRNPYPFLAKAQQEQRGTETPNDNEHSFERSKKKEITVKKLPDISLTDEEYAKLKNRLNKTSFGLTVKNLAKIKELEENRRKEEARLEDERRRQEEENLKALREMRRENKKAQKVKSGSKAKNTSKTLVVMPEQPQKQELTLEEKQELRRKSLKFPKVEEMSLDKAFNAYFLPLIDGFIKNGYYYKAPSLKNITTSFKAYLAYDKPMDDVYNTIRKLRDKIITLIYEKDTGKTSPTWLQNLNAVEFDNKTNLENILIGITDLIEVSDNQHDLLKKASSLLINSGNKRELRIFNPLVSTSYPAIIQSNELINNYDEYVQAVNKEAVAFYSIADVEKKFEEATKDLSQAEKENLKIRVANSTTENEEEQIKTVEKPIDKLEFLLQNNVVENIDVLLDDIIPKEQKALLKEIRNEINHIPDVTTYTGFALYIYILPLMKAIFDLLQKRGLVQVDTYKNLKNDIHSSKKKMTNLLGDFEVEVETKHLEFGKNSSLEDDTMIAAIIEDACVRAGVDKYLINKFGDVYNNLKAHTDKVAGNLTPVFQTKKSKELGYKSPSSLLFSNKEELEKFIDFYLQIVYSVSEEESV